MKEEPKLDFVMFSGDMLAQGRRFLDQFLENKTDFTNDYNVFKTPFETVMEDAIDLCWATDSDDICVGKQAEQTAIIEALMGVGRKGFQGGELFIKLTWDGNNNKLRLYGQPKYEAARSSHVKLPILLLQAYDFAFDIDNQALLIAQGFTLPKITALKTVADSINLAVRKQDKLKGARNLTTFERITNLNIVWAMMVKLSECAKKIYENNPAMWNLYLLYPGGSTPPPTPVPPAPTV